MLQSKSISDFLSRSGASSAGPTAGLNGTSEGHRFAPAAREVLETKVIARLEAAIAAIESAQNHSERRAAAAQSQEPINLALSHGRDFDCSTLELAGKALLLTADQPQRAINRLSTVVAGKLKARTSTLEEGARFFSLVRDHIYAAAPLVSRIHQCALERIDSLGFEVRRSLVEDLVAAGTKAHPLMKTLFAATVIEAHTLKAAKPGSPDLAQELTILKSAASTLDLGRAELLNRFARVGRSSPETFKDYERSDLSVRLGILRFYGDLALQDSPSYRALVRVELEALDRECFETVFLAVAELTGLTKVAPPDRAALFELLIDCFDAASDKHSLENLTNPSLIEPYLDLVRGGFFYQPLHQAFEDATISHLRSKGRASATLQRDCAGLLEVAARVKGCSKEFIDEVVRRADEHLKSVWDETGSAYQLMTYLAFVAPEKWAHVKTQIHAMNRSIVPSLPPEQARYCYLLRRLAGEPAGEIKIRLDQIQSGSVDDELMRLSAELESMKDVSVPPDTDLDPSALALGLIQVTGRGSSGLLLVYDSEGSSSDLVRYSSEMYRHLFSTFAPDALVASVSLPAGNRSAREDALRSAALKILYTRDLNDVGEADIPRLVDFD